MTTTPNQHIKNLSKLKAVREPLTTNWRDCYRYATPQRQQFQNKEQKEDEYRNLYDTTLIEATQLLTSSLQSGTVPANSPWFKMTLGNDDATSVDASDEWLDTVSKEMFKRIHATNFDSEVFDYLTDLVVAGWGALYISMNEKSKKLNFKCWPISNVYLDSYNEHETIDVVYREYELTGEQLINTYDTTPESVRKANLSAKYKIIHVICPNKEYKKAKVNIKSNMPFKSQIILVKEALVLEDSGYNSFPVIVARFNKNHNNLYATGQVNQVLEDSRIVNKMNKLFLNNAELALGGVWLAKNDGVLNVNNIKLRPRTIIPANNMDDLKRIDVGGSMNLSTDLVTMYQNRIRRGMMSDQLTPINSSPLSATEVSARVNILRNQLSGIFIRMQSEMLVGLLERVFDILMRNQLLPVPPKELVDSNNELNFSFTNPLAQSSKLEGLTNTNNFLNTILPLTQVNPAIMDILDLDKITYFIQDSLSISPTLLKTVDELKEIRDAQEAAKAQQAQIEQEALATQTVAQDQQLEAQQQQLDINNKVQEQL